MLVGALVNNPLQDAGLYRFVVLWPAASHGPTLAGDALPLVLLALPIKTQRALWVRDVMANLGPEPSENWPLCRHPSWIGTEPFRGRQLGSVFDRHRQAVSLIGVGRAEWTRRGRREETEWCLDRSSKFAFSILFVFQRCVTLA